MKGWPKTFVPSRGTHRRIQALAARGWSLPFIAEQLGMDRTTIHKVLRAPLVHPDYAERASSLYDRLWAAERPIRTPGERESITKALQYARSRRWQPPLAWDDIDLDDAPPAVDTRRSAVVDEIAVELAAAGHEIALTPEERAEAVRLLHSRRLSDPEIAERLHCSDRQVLRIRRDRLQLPANFNAAKELVAA